MKPEYRGIVHMVYTNDKIAGKFCLTGFGYGYYLPKFKQNERQAVIFAEEWKYGENDYRYEKKQFCFYNPYITGPFKED